MLKVYPRKFIGVTLDPVSDKTINRSVTFAGSTIRVLESEEKSLYTGSTTLANILSSHNKDPKYLDDFEHREEIIKYAKNTLRVNDDYPSFYSWIIMQIAANGITQTHIDAIFDILNYIFTGKEKLNLRMWEAILDDVKETRSIKDKQKVIDQLDKIYPKEYMDINKLLQQWLSHPEGCSHLFQTLWLFFGNPYHYAGR